MEFDFLPGIDAWITHLPNGPSVELRDGTRVLGQASWDQETGERVLWTIAQDDLVVDTLEPLTSDAAREVAWELAMVWTMTDDDPSNDYWTDADAVDAQLLADNHKPKGTLDSVRIGDSTIRFEGWTCDLDRPQAPLRVSLWRKYPDSYIGVGEKDCGPLYNRCVVPFVNRSYLGVATANVQRESAVGRACGGNRNHGFARSFSGGWGLGGQAFAFDIDTAGTQTGDTAKLNPN